MKLWSTGDSNNAGAFVFGTLWNHMDWNDYHVVRNALDVENPSGGEWSLWDYAVSGSKCEAIKTYLQSLLSAQPAPDVLIVQGGGNDVLAKIEEKRAALIASGVPEEEAIFQVTLASTDFTTPACHLYACYTSAVNAGMPWQKVLICKGAGASESMGTTDAHAWKLSLLDQGYDLFWSRLQAIAQFYKVFSSVRWCHDFVTDPADTALWDNGSIFAGIHLSTQGYQEVAIRLAATVDVL